jgi:hypothetical protein
MQNSKQEPHACKRFKREGMGTSRNLEHEFLSPERAPYITIALYTKDVTNPHLIG